MSYMESLTGNDKNTLVSSLISSGHVYQDPHEYNAFGCTSYVIADAYLSGNIREKIKEAQSAAEKDPVTFSRNVQALSEVLPKDIGPQDISLRMNSPIIGEQHIQRFIGELLNVREDRVNTTHIPMTGKWEIDVNKYRVGTSILYESYGTSRMNAVDIINSLMNGKPIKVYTKNPDDQPVLDQEATNAAELKAEAITGEFNKWIWRDQWRTDDIVKRYNEVYNSCVERTYTHPERMVNPNAEIWMHGCNFPYPLRQHQADAVWRVLQQDNNMLAHTVGAGKTLEMACSAMELRRLGIRNKPMIVCPDHMIGQWASEFRQAYPAAKMLIADDQNWDQENRRTFINKIATGDWDVVLIRAESFKMIPMSAEYQTKFFEDKIAEYNQFLSGVDPSIRKTRSVKDIEKAIEKYEEKITELADAHRDEGVIPFDKLGVDQVFIDEADLYKNLEYYTQLQNVRGLGTPKGSERALDMLMKIRYIQGDNGGVSFATGTPISNTLVETYTMQRFLQPEVLKANGLEAFDEWARQYAETVTQMELNNTGTGYTAVTRFSKIVNVPELVSSLRQVWDIQTAHNLEKNGILVPGVNLPTMKVINEAAPCTPLLQSYLKHLEYREKSLSGKTEKGKDNVLSIMTDGRKAAIDMRFINPNLPDDPRSKLNLAVKVINDVYTRYKEQRYTCAVFFDKSRSFDPTGNILFDGVADIKQKLVAKGIKPEEIGDVRECKTFAQRQQLFEKVRDGQVRVILGSTETMGAGTNFQKNLKAIVHVDAPWRPRDIEQQNGRGYRPGNKTGELEVYNLVTKGSLDTGLWNVLETKANSIRQVMDGSDKGTRQIEENYFGSVKDLSIDNPLMKEAVELDHSLKKLRSQEKSFNNDIAHAHRKVQSIPDQIHKSEEHTAKIKADMDMRQPEPKGDLFKIVLGGKQYDKRQDAGEFLKAEANTLFLQGKAAGRDIEKSIGTYAGLPLILRSTIHDFAANGRLSACAQNFRCSADIKPESSPVGICQSFHNQLYKGMDKMHSESLQATDNLIKSQADYQAKLSAIFPKIDELKTKELRYMEVMKALDEQSKQSPQQVENPHDIPWTRLNTLSKEQIDESVKNLIKNSIQQPNIAEKTIKFETVKELVASIRETHSVNLPPTIVSTLESAVKTGSLKINGTHELITKSIDQLQHQGNKWKQEPQKDIHSAYMKEIEKLTIGDIIIRQVDSQDTTIYEAYKITNDNCETSKFLGSEKSYDSIKSRVEQYITCNFIKERISETLTYSKPTEKIEKVQEKPQEYGMDI